MEDRKNIVCRPNAALLAAGFLCLICVAAYAALPAFFPGQSPQTVCLIEASASFYGLPAAMGVVWGFRARVTADAQGIRWRGLGRPRSAAWSQISDYYVELLKGKSTVEPPLVLIIDGKPIRIRSGLWTSIPALKDLIRQNCAHIGSQEWKILGTRSDRDWPITFEYSEREIRTNYRLMYGIIAVFAVGGAFLARGFLTTFRWTDPAHGLFIAMTELLWIASLFLYVSAGFKIVPATRRRVGERITVGVHGVHYCGPHGEVNSSWEDITGLKLECPANTVSGVTHYCVATRNGAFDFLYTISHANLLIKLLPECAVDQAAAFWDDSGADALNVCNWSGGTEAAGRRVFGYRTHTIRAGLWFLSALVAIPWFTLGVVTWFGLTSRSNVHTMTECTAISGAFVVWCWWRYASASVQIDEDRITQNGLSGSTTIAWVDVERYNITGSDIFTFGNVIGKGKRVRFFISIADVALLKREIERRAVNSETKGWTSK